MADFEFIVVGAGSAGCVIANRLSADGRHRVLLIEAGPKDRNPWIHFTMGVGKTISNPAINWMMSSEPEPNAGGRRIAVPRGKVLGGSSSINGGVYVRGSAADFDHWAQLGCRGWGYEDVLPYFRKSERFERGADRYRGDDGPLYVSDVRERDAMLDAMLDAAEAAGYPRNPDVNGAQREGFAYSQTTTRGGFRNSTAQAYLKPARGRPNLTVWTGCTVRKVLIEGRKAVGVALDRGNGPEEVRAGREVILSTGAINSPALLQLSGIGAAEGLRDLGIAPVADRPEVGRNLQDHWAVWMRWRVQGHLTLNERTRGWRAVVEGLRFAFQRRGALTMPAGPMMGFVRTRPELDEPDVQYHFAPFSFATSEKRQLDRFPGLTVSALVLRPESRGSVGIASADPTQAPKIRFDAFSAEYDMDRLVVGMRIARDIVNADPMRRFRPTETAPGTEVASDADLRDHIRANGNSCFHASGTCRMGADPASVVDPDLKVRGVEGLRVADASVMPAIVSANTNATTIMIGEKAADLVLQSALMASAA